MIIELVKLWQPLTQSLTSSPLALKLRSVLAQHEGDKQNQAGSVNSHYVASKKNEDYQITASGINFIIDDERRTGET